MILDRWVIIATENSRRPVIFGESIINPVEEKECPFCPGKENLTPPEILAYRPDNSLPNTTGWITRVISNKFHALHVEGVINRTGIGIYDKMSGIGAHEIIIESTNHNIDTYAQELKTIENTIWAYRDRITDLKKDQRLKYVLIFKNRGWAAGATLDHPHSNLIATPIIPIRVTEEITSATRYYKYKERCIFCDIVQQELSSRERLIIEHPSFISFTPFASTSPFESWIIPRKHSSNFEEITAGDVAELAKILKETLRKISIALNKPAYNYILHTAPIQEDHRESYHWHIEIIPTVTKVAGFEWGTGFYINPTSPEDSARYLRSL